MQQCFIDLFTPLSSAVLSQEEQMNRVINNQNSPGLEEAFLTNLSGNQLVLARFDTADHAREFRIGRDTRHRFRGIQVPMHMIEDVDAAHDSAAGNNAAAEAVATAALWQAIGAGADGQQEEQEQEQQQEEQEVQQQEEEAAADDNAMNVSADQQLE
eukprot:4661-Heterococcus_DN1.PRE.1